MWWSLQPVTSVNGALPDSARYKNMFSCTIWSQESAIKSKVDTWLTEFRIDWIPMVLQKGYVLNV